MIYTKQQTQQAIALLLEKLAYPSTITDDGVQENDEGEEEQVLVLNNLPLEIWFSNVTVEEERVGIVTRKIAVETTRYTLFPVSYDAGDRDTPPSMDVGIPTIVYGLPKCLEVIAAMVSDQAIQWIMESLDED